MIQTAEFELEQREKVLRYTRFCHGFISCNMSRKMGASSKFYLGHGRLTSAFKFIYLRTYLHFLDPERVRERKRRVKRTKREVDSNEERDKN